MCIDIKTNGRVLKQLHNNVQILKQVASYDICISRVVNSESAPYEAKKKQTFFLWAKSCAK